MTKMKMQRPAIICQWQPRCKVCHHSVLHRMLTAIRTAAMAMGRKAQQKAEVKRKIDMGATEVEDANAGIEGGNTDAGVPTTASKKLRIDASADGSTGP